MVGARSCFGFVVHVILMCPMVGVVILAMSITEVNYPLIRKMINQPHMQYASTVIFHKIEFPADVLLKANKKHYQEVLRWVAQADVIDEKSDYLASSPGLKQKRPGSLIRLMSIVKEEE